MSDSVDEKCYQCTDYKACRICSEIHDVAASIVGEPLYQLDAASDKAAGDEKSDNCQYGFLPGLYLVAESGVCQYRERQEHAEMHELVGCESQNCPRHF